MRTVITGLITAVLFAIGMPAATAGDPDFGRMWRADGVLRPSCHNYKYHYKVTPPKPNWSLETFLVDPRGETIASGALDSAIDPKRGTARFRFCRYNTTHGRFKLRGKLTYDDGYDQFVKWVKPGYFRLHKPS